MRLLCVALFLIGLGVAGTAVFGSVTSPVTSGAPVEADAGAFDSDATMPEATGPLVPVSLVENVVEQPYSVSGASAKELRASLNRRGPYDVVSGQRVDGLTLWDLRWTFRYDTAGDSCRLAAANVRIDIVVNLPELSTPDGLNEQTLSRWEAYVAALREHEAGHTDRQLEGARHLQSLYESALAAPTCRELSSELAALGEAQIAAGRRLDADYDAETGHGRTQGAVFP